MHAHVCQTCETWLSLTDNVNSLRYNINIHIIIHTHMSVYDIYIYILHAEIELQNMSSLTPLEVGSKSVSGSQPLRIVQG